MSRPPMSAIDPAQDDEAFLDALLEEALCRRADGRELRLDDVLRGREHLRSRAETLVGVAVDVAPVTALSFAEDALGRLAGYTILGEAGRGSMGIVYRARQERLGRVVALKVLAPALMPSASARERFAVEARALGRVRHPHVVAVHDVVATTDLCAYAMEWIEGRSLAAAVAAKDPSLEVPAVARLGATLARALAAVHAEGLVHRDVKPSNVLLRPDGTPVLTDFSLVRDAEQSLHTATGEFVGTAAFAAPEQLRGQHDRIGPWTDVYALAATLHVAATGAPPFESHTTADVLRRIESGARLSLRKLNPKVPVDFETIVAKAMDPEPSRRYATATELAEDLERMLRIEPIRARPAGTALRLQRFVARSPHLALALAGLLVVLVLGLAVSIYFTVHLRAAEQRALDHGQIQTEYAEFLRWVFRMGDAAGWGRPDMTVLEALDKVASEVNTGVGIATRPQTHYLIHMMVVETFVDIGKLEEAQRHLAAARDIAAQVFGPDSAQAGDVLQYFGRVHRGLGRMAEAEASLREAVRIRRTLGGPRELDLAQSMTSLGIVLRHSARFAEAEDMYRQALEIYRRRNPDGDSIPLVLTNLATVYVNERKFDQAERHQAEALEILTKMHNGQPHVDVAHAQFGLGSIQVQAGQREAGEANMRAGLEMTRTAVGTKFGRYAQQCSQLAQLLTPTRPAEAEAFRRASMASFLELQNPNSAGIEATALAALLVAGDRPAEAESVLTDILARGGEYPARLGMLRQLGTAQSRLAKFEAADGTLAQAWKLAAGADDAARQATAAALADHYAAWHQAAPDPDRAARADEWRGKAGR